MTKTVKAKKATEKEVEHFKSFVVLASAVLTNQEGRVLLLRRSQASKNFRGLWQLPEGKVELGESPSDTLRRELNEELGYQVAALKIATSHTVEVEAHGTKYNVLRIVYTGQCTQTPTLSDEHDKYLFVKPSELPEVGELVAGTREIIGEFVQ